MSTRVVTARWPKTMEHRAGWDATFAASKNPSRSPTNARNIVFNWIANVSFGCLSPRPTYPRSNAPVARKDCGREGRLYRFSARVFRRSRWRCLWSEDDGDWGTDILPV